MAVAPLLLEKSAHDAPEKRSLQVTRSSRDNFGSTMDGIVFGDRKAAP